MNRRIRLFIIAWIAVTAGGAFWCEAGVEWRWNQVGYGAYDPKRILVGSKNDLEGTAFEVRRFPGGERVFHSRLETLRLIDPADSPFPFLHLADVSSLQLEGEYRLQIGGHDGELRLRIGVDRSAEIIASLVRFLRAQRCGDRQTEGRRPCHLQDPTNTALDLRGGWHDAGDFLKFTRQIAYTTYLLLLSHELASSPASSHPPDRAGNGNTDVLAEARFGLDYLVKCYPDEFTFVLSVGDFEADHSQGPRMPEDDRLAAKRRPAIAGFRRDDLAKYAYTMALAAKVFAHELRDPVHRRYRELAERAYRKAKETGDGQWDKLCLAAVELYAATGEETYRQEAVGFHARLGVSGFGNYSDNTNLAHARLARYHPPAAEILRRSVAAFWETSRKHPFGFAVPCTWGSLYVQLSAGSAALFYHRLTGTAAFLDMFWDTRDYVFGRNPWGISWISGWGERFPRYLHHNISMVLHGARKPEKAVAAMHGAVAEGPVAREAWEKEFKRRSPAGRGTDGLLQTERCVYYDHENDYMTNEPTIYGAAEAILFFSLGRSVLSRLEAVDAKREPSRGKP